MDRAQPQAAGPAPLGPDEFRAAFPGRTEADRGVEGWIASRDDGPDDSPAQAIGRCPVLRSARVGGVIVLAPTVPSLDDEATIDAIRDRLEALVAGVGPAPRVVLDLAPVACLSGRAIGLILSQHLRFRQAGGCLRLAQASELVATAMELVGLPTQVEVFPTLDDAVRARWAS